MSRAAEAAMAASYKALKEDFVSNLSGGEIGEINYVAAVAPVSFTSPTTEYANSSKGCRYSLVSTTIAAVLL
jgi:phosphatidylinositol glycan class W